MAQLVYWLLFARKLEADERRRMDKWQEDLDLHTTHDLAEALGRNHEASETKPLRVPVKTATDFRDDALIFFEFILYAFLLIAISYGLLLYKG